MKDKEIQSLINILLEAKWASESFKKARLMDCYNDLKWILKEDLDLIDKRRSEIALWLYKWQTKNIWTNAI